MNSQHKKIAISLGSLLWKVIVFCIMVVMWMHIAQGLLDKDYMKTIAWTAVMMLVRLNEIEEKL